VTVRVGFLVEQALAPVPGGTGRYSSELATALARTAQPGDSVTGWCAYHRRSAPATLPGVLGPVRLPLPRRALAAGWQRGVGPVPTGVDLVHAPTLLVPPPRRGVRLVVTIHDAVPWTHPHTLTPHGVRWHREMGERAARHADAVVVPTEAVAADLRAHLPIPAERIHVITEGVAEAVLRVPADADGRAARLGLPAGGYLLTLATLEPRKGLDVALAALREPGAPDLPLLHVGATGWGGQDVHAEARRLGLSGGAGERSFRPRDSDGGGGSSRRSEAEALSGGSSRRSEEMALGVGRFRSLGRLDDADLAVVLSRATALVAPSRSEGFGLPVVEAMAHGVPVVVSDAPALVEVGGDAVLVAPVGDPAALAAATARIVADPALRGRMSAMGRARAADFTWIGAACACWALYRRIIGCPAVSAADDGRA
jgi:glycosyltransferase involved in cell wall biosynthesis